ncbi:MAG: FAD-binding oxidoreductase [Ardenticatenales bacterium]|nr:FAD-binding oxidoreductase [Ardenticatenales bacterium]
MSTPHWHADLTPPVAPLTELPPHADILVVGAGLTGTWLALALAEVGRPPLVLERAHLAAGASGRNGGLLLPGTAELYPALVARHGPAAARTLWAWAVAGAADVVATIRRYGIDCDWRPEGALHAAVSEAEATHLHDAAALLAADGFSGEWLSASDVAAWLDVPRPVDIHGALHLPDGGAFHSGRLVAGLAAAAASRGATFVEGIDVRGIDRRAGDSDAVNLQASDRRTVVEHHPDQPPIVVHTDRGPITAEVVVVATNAWLPELLPGFRDAVVPVRGQVLSSRPLPKRIIRGAWSLNNGYEYLQQLSDGRLVFGGMRWSAPDREVGPHFVAPDVNDAIHSGLDRWLAGHFPSLPITVERRWAGPMCWTADRLPLVGPVAAPSSGLRGDTDVDPATARLWITGAYSGHGVPVAPAAARLVAAGLTGRAMGPAAPLVVPTRPLADPVAVATP